MKIELADWLDSINHNKKDLIKDDPDLISGYTPYVINRLMSAHLDTILYANEMNRYYTLDKDLQYQFYRNAISKKKRFSDWKRKKEISDLDNVKQYYGYNTDRAREALRILSREQLDYINKKLNVGGPK
jgi:hypothetical protein